MAPIGKPAAVARVHLVEALAQLQDVARGIRTISKPAASMRALEALARLPDVARGIGCDRRDLRTWRRSASRRGWEILRGFRGVDRGSPRDERKSKIPETARPIPP